MFESKRSWSQAGSVGSTKDTPSRAMLATSGEGMPLAALGVVLALLLLGGWYYFTTQKNKDASQDQPTSQPLMLVVPFTALNNSGEIGNAVLRERDGKVHIEIDVANAPKDVPQPAHIHRGSCPAPSEVKYPLSSVVKGQSDTTLDTTLKDLLAALPLAVNVHKSETEAGTYVSCGNITREQLVPDNQNESDVPDITMPPPMPPAGNSSAVTTPSPTTRTVNITAEDFKFSLAEIRVKKGERVVVVFASKGKFPHDWVVDEFNLRTQRISGDITDSVEFTADKAGTFEYYCSVGTHRQMGMKGKLIVE